MAVNYISLPNLGTDIALIESEITAIEDAAEEAEWNNTLIPHIKPRFIFKGSEDCSTFYLEDVTDYQEIRPTDTDDVSINVTFFYRTVCGDIVPCSSEPFGVNSKATFENIYGDGKYCVKIDVTLLTEEYRTVPIVPIYITESFEYCLTQDCCQNKVIDLRKEIADCMASLSCKINEFKCLGRNYVKLTSRYLKMSNLLWVMDNTKSSCDDYGSFACLFKKI